MKFFQFGWFMDSVIALFLLIPAWLAIQFFKKNFGIPAEIFVIYYFFATSLGAFILSRVSGHISSASFFFPAAPLVAIFLFGVTIGAVINLLVFRAVGAAPNPGLSLAITGTAAVFVALISWLLGFVSPHYFEKAALSYSQILGIIFAVAAVFLIGVKK